MSGPALPHSSPAASGAFSSAQGLLSRRKNAACYRAEARYAIAAAPEPVQPCLPLVDAVWIPVLAADDSARAMFHRHYSYIPRSDGYRPLKFVGPGEALVLVTPDARAVFVWRKFRSAANQEGVNCSLFRNEGAGLSSDLIRAADELAWAKWPGERHYTYVNPRKIRSTNPGWCFINAGWRRCGLSKKRKYVILERLP